MDEYSSNKDLEEIYEKNLKDKQQFNQMSELDYKFDINNILKDLWAAP